MHLMYACVDRIYCTYNITCMCGSHLMYTDIQIRCMYRMWCLCACMHVRMYHIWCMMYASQVHVCIVSNVCAYVCICLLNFTWGFNFYAALCNNSAWPPLCTFRAVIGFWSMVIVGLPLACTKFRGQENDIRELACPWPLKTLWNGHTIACAYVMLLSVPRCRSQRGRR